jgi:hypothetical protein
MRIKTAITGFAVVLVVMSLIGGFSAFLRHYILGTPNLVHLHDAQIKELQEKFVDEEQ